LIVLVVLVVPAVSALAVIIIIIIIVVVGSASQIMIIDRKTRRELMRSCHTFRKSHDRSHGTGTSPVGCHSLGTALILAATAQIAGGLHH
jgi:hypothetical protein